MNIRMSLLQELAEMDKLSMGHIASMSYSYCQLCVVADGSSLLPIEMIIDGDVKHIEDVANIILHTVEDEGDDVTIDVIYKDPAYISTIIDGVHNYHPEFKITVETLENAPDDNDLSYKFIRLVMPEVNDDRHDFLTNIVKTYHDAFIPKIDTVKAKTLAAIAKKSIGVPSEELDETKAKVDQAYDTYIKLLDQARDEKLEQIERAYQDYLNNHPDGDSSKKENDGKSGMKMDDDKPKETSSSEAPEQKPAPAEEKPAEEKPAEKKPKFGQSLKME